mmetsp:Transcript_10144/g.16615  ORF Transcript_10144/g.16615 Transcript_10144/m.16615 type:complete len:343 (+) Transcript_10144:454-1482(+)|eukprot:CAMPEP_0203775376 /NCGR_PEP_ID=MMETSP0099_2-20121227/6043_1 /ASSEMBLY_ACC=CAM_ASM_000209 /TAXON_ID=96639 /ORGANISM=" , Strain NY0313808BC1" /LENGTH=342 /DNA_ID=CAMNT_0050674039 /DNA_START=92 /DNA_END=1123 /DNA_ORIENTATION=+
MLSLEAVDVQHGDRDAVRRQLMKQLETVGFLALRNIDQYDEEMYFNCCKALHQMPNEEKKKLYLSKDQPRNCNSYRGYFPFQGNDPSHKEFFDMGFPMDTVQGVDTEMPLYEETPWPKDEKYAHIRQGFEKTREAWFNVALLVVELLAEGLGKDAGFFEHWFRKSTLTTFRSIHYLPRSAAVVDSNELTVEQAKLTTPEHSDSGFLTFLATFGYPGLQVLVGEEYVDVAPVSNTLVVNVGDMFARLTNYRLKATYHRVVDIGVERYSSPMFLEPRYSARIPKGLLGSSNTTSVEECADDDSCMYGDWLVKRFTTSYVEWENFEIPESRRAAIANISVSDFVN